MSNLRQFQPTFMRYGWPFLYPVLFGSGADGAVVTAGGGSGNVSDAGYLGSYVAKHFTNFTLSAGDTFSLPTASYNGAMIIAAQGTLTIAGTISGPGQNGGNGAAGTSGKGGDTAGAGTGGAAVTANAVGVAGSDTLFTKRGHGGTSPGVNGPARGGASGAHVNNSATNFAGVTCVGQAYSSANAASLAPNAQGINVGGVNASASGTSPTNGTTQGSSPTASVVGFNALGFLPLLWLPPGLHGSSGGVTGVASQEASAGGGGGGGGVLYIEADTIDLVPGYAINLYGGNGGNGYSSNGTTAVAGGGMPGGGGRCILICRTLIGSTSAINLAAGSPGTGAGTGAANGASGIAGDLLIIKI